MRTALITGVTGQDGSYLAEFLLSKGYRVIGLLRRSSSFNTGRIDHLLEDPRYSDRFDYIRGDMTDGSSLARILRIVQPDEIYNLAAQSHVKVSFETPEYTADADFMGVVRLLEAVRDSGLNPRIYQAGSSEMFGNAPAPQSETTPFSPRSPYAVAKVAAFYFACNYREAYGLWVANGILFNHESPRRGETFVTRKITRAVARIKLGVQDCLYLGNLDASRDWGYAPEYVEAMWLMLQQPNPDDYVIATGETHTVREFVEEAFTYAGMNWRDYVKIDPRLFRPTEVDLLCGDASKARRVLGWRPKTSFEELVRIMVDADLARERLLLEGTAAHHQEWRTHV
ncbi:MAG TPA: GDP-mannose 4,6-dehydratase [Clostridia bacterium]|nr:GDP-mannose 4,6-dehydratase [Clostridia bacterium]